MTDFIYYVLKSEPFSLLVLPTAITFFSALVRAQSRHISTPKIEWGDFDIGYDLYIGAIVSLGTFVMLLADRFHPITAGLSKDQADALTAANNAIKSALVVSGWTALGFAFLLLLIVGARRQFGWERLRLASGGEIFQSTREAIIVVGLLGALTFAVAVKLILENQPN